MLIRVDKVEGSWCKSLSQWSKRYSRANPGWRYLAGIPFLRSIFFSPPGSPKPTCVGSDSHGLLGTTKDFGSIIIKTAEW